MCELFLYSIAFAFFSFICANLSFFFYYSFMPLLFFLFFSLSDVSMISVYFVSLSLTLFSFVVCTFTIDLKPGLEVLSIDDESNMFQSFLACLDDNVRMSFWLHRWSFRFSDGRSTSNLKTVLNKVCILVVFFSLIIDFFSSLRSLLPPIYVIFSCVVAVRKIIAP